MGNNVGMVTSSVVTTTSQHKRDFSEMLRRLNPEMVKMLALVDGTNLDPWGKVAYTGNGMIKKKAVTRLDPEWAIYVPVDIHYQATGGSPTTAVIADTTGWSTGDKIVNTDTAEVAIVNTLTNSTTLAVTPVDGSTWSCSAGQWVTMISSTYEEGTSRYSVVSNEPTVCKTRLETFREGVSIAEHVKYTPEYINEKAPQRYKTDKTLQALRKLEGSLFHAKEATNGTTSVTIGGTAYSLSSMKGLLTYAGTAISMGGVFSHETWNTVLYPQMPTTLRGDEVCYAFTSRKIAASMNQWAQDNFLTATTNANEERFGKKIKTYLMGGGLDVELVVHEQFEKGGLADSMLIVQSSDLEYLHLKNNDVKVRENAQLPSTMGETSIIEGIIGLRSWSNGANIKLVTNLLSAA